MASQIVFTKKFATHKKGDVEEYDGMLASHLVHKAKVAKYTNDQNKIFSEIKAQSELRVLAQKALRDKAAKSRKAKIAKAIKKPKK